VLRRNILTVIGRIVRENHEQKDVFLFQYHQQKDDLCVKKRQLRGVLVWNIT